MLMLHGEVGVEAVLVEMVEVVFDGGLNLLLEFLTGIVSRLDVVRRSEHFVE